MSSKFLGLTSNISSLAQENTLGEINDKLISLDVTVTNTPLPVAGAGGGDATIIDVVTGGLQTNDLEVSVTNLANPMPVSGTVSVSNLNNPMPVSGTVAVSGGSVDVDNFPATQSVNIHSFNGNTPVIGDLDYGRALCTTLATNSPNLFESNLGFTNPATVSSTNPILPIRVGGFCEDVDDGGFSQLGGGITTAGILFKFPGGPLDDFYAVSTSAQDDGVLAEDGARTIRYYYCDEAGTEYSELITLAGTTPVLVEPSNSCFRFKRVVVVSVGIESNLGLITLYETGLPANYFDAIGIGNNTSSVAKLFWPADTVFNFKTLNVAGYSLGADDFNLVIEAKGARQEIWHKLFSFFGHGNSVTPIAWTLNGQSISPKTITGDPNYSYGADMRIKAVKMTAGGQVSIQAYLGGFTTTDP